MKTKKWKADEMEMTINFKAMRLSYVFTQLSLVVYCIVYTAIQGNLPLWPFIIMCISNFIFICSKLIITKNLTGGADSNEQ